MATQRVVKSINCIISWHDNVNVDIDARVVIERTTLQISFKYSKLEPMFGRIVDIRHNVDNVDVLVWSEVL